MTAADDSKPIGRVLLAGITLLIPLCLIRNLSSGFIYEQAQIARPLLLVLSLFAVAFAVHLCGLWYGLRTNSKYLLPLIVGFAIVYRALLLLSVPIQEIDIYRYIWDGTATAAGVSPFEFAPQEILNVGQASPGDHELARLTEQLRSPAKRYILERVHYGQLPTVYPPVSQAVFALASLTTPANASFETHLFVMKSWLLVFDLGTLVFIGLTLRQVGWNMGWLISYAWCPLVLKEFANSGHLDAIAVCLSSAAVYFACRAFFKRNEVIVDFKLPYTNFGMASVGCVCLGLAVGAKLYPVVLVPILALTAWRRFPWQRTLLLGAIFVSVTTISLLPMLMQSDRQLPTDTANAEEQQQSTMPPARTTVDRQAGLKVFLSQWMMNDFIFLNLAENVTPDRLRGAGMPKPWFVVVPDGWRELAVSLATQIYWVTPEQAPFSIARTITALLFLLLAIWFAQTAAKTAIPEDWLQYVFLTLAWFWLLLPTLNPWYWIWAMPWLAFAKNKTWVLMSGLLFIYYLRFHFAAHYQGRLVWSVVPYEGEAFFDYVVVWFEYVPWFICLIGMYWFRSVRLHPKQ